MEAYGPGLGGVENRWREDGGRGVDLEGVEKRSGVMYARVCEIEVSSETGIVIGQRQTE